MQQLYDGQSWHGITEKDIKSQVIIIKFTNTNEIKLFRHSSTIIIFVTTSLTVFFAAGFSFHEMLRRKSAVEEGPMVYIVESRRFHVVGRTTINCVCLFSWCLTYFFLCTKCPLN